MRTIMLSTASILVLSFATGAFAKSAEDAAYDKTNKPVYDSQGKCVRTLWQEDSDPCAPAAAPAPKPVPVAMPAPAPKPMPVITQEQRTVYFDFNSANLTGGATDKLDQLAAIINHATAITGVSIHGFTDQIGSESYNATLAHKRAQAVKAYLDSKSRLVTTEGDVRGLGKSSPDAACEKVKKRAARIACMNKERRVEVEFSAEQPQ